MIRLSDHSHPLVLDSDVWHMRAVMWDVTVKKTPIRYDMSLFVDMLKIGRHDRHIHYHSSVPSVPTLVSVINRLLKHFSGFGEAGGNVLCFLLPFWNTVRHLHTFLVRGNGFVWMFSPVPPFSPPYFTCPLHQMEVYPRKTTAFTLRGKKRITGWNLCNYWRVSHINLNK